MYRRLPRAWAQRFRHILDKLPRDRSPVVVERVLPDEGSPPVRKVSLAKSKSKTGNDSAQSCADVERTGQGIVVSA